MCNTDTIHSKNSEAFATEFRYILDVLITMDDVLVNYALVSWVFTYNISLKTINSC